MTNLERKARCCESDLRFLISVLPDHSSRRNEIVALILEMRNNPTDEQINAAWKIAAIIHEEIRRNGHQTNS